VEVSETKRAARRVRRARHGGASAAHELVEVAALAVLRLLLIQERELLLVELLEELLPGNLLERLVAVVGLRKVGAQQTRVVAVARADDACRMPVAALGPLLDLVVIRGALRFAHGSS